MSAVSLLSALLSLAIEDAAWNLSTAASLNTAVRESDPATPAVFPAPRPYDGTLDVSIAPAFLAAVATPVLMRVL